MFTAPLHRQAASTTGTLDRPQPVATPPLRDRKTEIPLLSRCLRKQTGRSSRRNRRPGEPDRSASESEPY